MAKSNPKSTRKPTFRQAFDKIANSRKAHTDRIFHMEYLLNTDYKDANLSEKDIIYAQQRIDNASNRVYLSRGTKKEVKASDKVLNRYEGMIEVLDQRLENVGNARARGNAYEEMNPNNEPILQFEPKSKYPLLYDPASGFSQQLTKANFVDTEFGNKKAKKFVSGSEEAFPIAQPAKRQADTGKPKEFKNVNSAPIEYNRPIPAVKTAARDVSPAEKYVNKNIARKHGLRMPVNARTTPRTPIVDKTKQNPYVVSQSNNSSYSGVPPVYPVKSQNKRDGCAPWVLGTIAVAALAGALYLLPASKHNINKSHTNTKQVDANQQDQLNAARDAIKGVKGLPQILNENKSPTTQPNYAPVIEQMTPIDNNLEIKVLDNTMDDNRTSTTQPFYNIPSTTGSTRVVEKGLVGKIGDDLSKFGNTADRTYSSDAGQNVKDSGKYFGNVGKDLGQAIKGVPKVPAAHPGKNILKNLYDLTIGNVRKVGKDLKHKEIKPENTLFTWGGQEVSTIGDLGSNIGDAIFHSKKDHITPLYNAKDDALAGTANLAVGALNLGIRGPAHIVTKEGTESRVNADKASNVVAKGFPHWFRGLFQHGLKDRKATKDSLRDQGRIITFSQQAGAGALVGYGASEAASTNDVTKVRTGVSGGGNGGPGGN